MAMDVAPTTAYIMLGGRCTHNCRFCAQAHDSTAHADALSRVIWPPYPVGEVIAGVSRAHAEGDIGRVCFQVTASPGYLGETLNAVSALASRSPVPICASITPASLDDLDAVFAAGAQRVSLALDGACERIYHRAKSGRWDHALAHLEKAAARYPGRVGTHLIVGLGETDRELASLAQRLADQGITIALFAFTPVPGTPMAATPPPPLARYRRAQAVRWLISQGLAHAAHFTYDQAGSIVDLGLAEDELHAWLAGGEAFRTAGCPDCNRPYYNERPAGRSTITPGHSHRRRPRRPSLSASPRWPPQKSRARAGPHVGAPRNRRYTMPIQTRLYDRHVALGGRMVEYAGFLLPVQYPAGPKAEHLRVRHAAGLFDIDHMGQVAVRGPDALAFLQHVLTADVSSFAPGSANYALLCYADGTVVDDTFVYVREDHYLVVINAANNAKDTRWLRATAAILTSRSTTSPRAPTCSPFRVQRRRPSLNPSATLT
jgi:biotin synthase